MDFRNLAIRTLSGFIYVAVVICAIWIGPGGVSVLAILFAVLGFYELHKNDKDYSNIFVDLIEYAALACLIGTPLVPDLFSFWVLLLCLRFFIQVFVYVKNPLNNIAMACFGQFYLGVPLLAFVFLAMLFRQAPLALILLIAMIWINDTGAYLVGCTIGKHKMFPRLSPKKSWEGFGGGLIFNVIAGIVISLFVDFPFSPYIDKLPTWICMGIVVSILSTVGDLFESMIKRSLNIKDSGKLIPGHGGILDRIDSLLFVAPGIGLLIIFFFHLNYNLY